MPLALVTGASRGIGKAIAIALAHADYDVALSYNTQQHAAEEVATTIRAQGKNAYVLQLDLSNLEQTQHRIEYFVKEHGCPDAVINNAGIAHDGMFALMSPNHWQHVIDTNLNGFYAVTKPILRPMLKRRSGRIINIASIAGLRGNAGQVNYSASKAGLIGATKALALEVASRGICVNAIAPGFIETEMLQALPQEKIVSLIPLQRLGAPEDVAHAAVFLCSEKAAYITGQVLTIDGGLYT